MSGAIALTLFCQFAIAEVYLFCRRVGYPMSLPLHPHDRAGSKFDPPICLSLPAHHRLIMADREAGVMLVALVQVGLEASGAGGSS
jgi:hypothetical protein